MCERLKPERRQPQAWLRAEGAAFRGDEAPMDRLRDDEKNRHREAAQCTFGFARPCAHSRTRLRWRPMREGGMHLGDHCLDCGRWFRWVPQRAGVLAQAPPRPPR